MSENLSDATSKLLHDAMSSIEDQLPPRKARASLSDPPMDDVLSFARTFLMGRVGKERAVLLNGRVEEV